MKKVLILIGSPRKRGNTADMAKMLQGHIEGEGYRCRTLFLYDHEIGPCLDCRACKTADLVCTVNDGMRDLYPLLEEADILVFGNPVYWFGPTAKTKLLVDRLRPYYGNKKLSGRKAALLLPAGSGAGDCDLTVEMFRRTFEALGIASLGAAFSKAYDMGDSAVDPPTAEAVERLAAAVKK